MNFAELLAKAKRKQNEIDNCKKHNFVSNGTSEISPPSHKSFTCDGCGLTVGELPEVESNG